MSQPPYGTIPYYTPAIVPNPRPKSVTVMAILGIIIGAMGVICTPLAILPYFVQFGPPNPVIDMMKNDRLMFVWTLASTIVRWPVAMLLMACSIGALSLQPWARKGLIAWALIDVLLTVTGTAFSLLLYLPRVQAMSASGNALAANAARGTVIGAVVGLIVGMVLPLAMLYILSRPHVEAAFDRSGQASSTGSTPAAAGPWNAGPLPPDRTPGNPSP